MKPLSPPPYMPSSLTKDGPNEKWEKVGMALKKVMGTHLLVLGTRTLRAMPEIGPVS